MENRLSEILHKKEQCLMDGETLIYLKDGAVIARHNDGETLHEVTTNLQDSKGLDNFLFSIFGDDE